MDIEISVGIIALAFVVLVIFLVRTLIDLRKTINQANKTLAKFEKIPGDVLESLNSLLHPFSRKQTKSEKTVQLKKPYNTIEKAADVMDCVSSGIHLFNKIRASSKTHDKAR